MDKLTTEVSRLPKVDIHIQDIVIEPSKGWTGLELRDFWSYRELLYLLVWREIRGMYRQTALGITWLFFRPILNVVVLTVVFGGFVKVPSNDLPYALFSLSALLPWLYFTNAVNRSSGSLVQNMEIISKVYFPRAIITISGVLSGLVDMGASFVIFFIVMFIYRMPLRVEILWLPVYIFLTMAFALAAGLWLATLSVKYRDVSFAVNFILQAMMYASPVIYPVSMVPEKLRFLYQLNPMTGIIQGFRWALLASGDAPGISLVIAAGIILLMLVTGAFIFRRTERTIVDVL